VNTADKSTQPHIRNLHHLDTYLLVIYHCLLTLHSLPAVSGYPGFW